ncbi:hypothetical protein [Acidithiobacillus sp. AMEEHan]|uniref:DoxX family protein n=1 Tax=Acidithiobacillus sp. AMEEHan TaxID=2994951 RepID=UPI0027E4DC85|nr:hypothetical protein [Acidithiobacillus sp. AMEEHan]
MTSASRREIFKRSVLVFVFFWFFFGSLAHFLFTRAEAGIVPTYIPFHRLDVYVSGVLEMLGAIGVLFKRARSWAGIGLFLLTIAVTPANIHMAMHWRSYPEVSPWILNARLVFQVIFLAGIWWSTGASKYYAPFYKGKH